MTSLLLRRRSASLCTKLVAPLAVLSVTACSDAEYVYYPYYPYPYYPPGPPPPQCAAGVSDGSVDADAQLDLDPGLGVGVTVEYASDGSWRFAATCDTYYSFDDCSWTLVVSPIDGVIDDFAPEALESSDILEPYPTTAGSDEEDGVLFDVDMADDIDAFWVFATPGAGMRVSATIDDHCAGPFVFWTDGGSVRHSTTNPTDLFPGE